MTARACYDGQNFFDTDHPVGEQGSQETVSNVQTGAGPAWYLLDTTRPVNGNADRGVIAELVDEVDRRFRASLHDIEAVT